MKKYKAFIILILFLSPLFTVFAQIENVGIIPSNIWYSKDPFEEKDKIKIYTVVYNPDKRELSGTVIFFDNNVFLGKKDFSIPPKSTKDVSVDWTVSIGEHLIFAKIENAKFLISEGKYEEIYIPENKTVESKRTVSKKIDLKDAGGDLLNSINESNAVSNIKELVKNNTPPFVTEAIDATIFVLESTRESANSFSNDKKDQVKKEIEILNEIRSNPTKGDISEGENNKNIVMKEKLNWMKKENVLNIIRPLKYIELFILSLFSFIFEHKILFYCLLFIILFSTLRFVWRLIF
jgi:hypothetical protein